MFHFIPIWRVIFITGINWVLLNLVQEFIEIVAWVTSDLFHMFTRSIKFYTIHSRI